MKTLINFLYLFSAILLLLFSTGQKNKSAPKPNLAKKGTVAAVKRSKEESKACCAKPTSRKALLIRK